MVSHDVNVAGARAVPAAARPFAVGDRVRCRISTRGSHPVEWQGCLATVVRVKRYAGVEDGSWWDVAVTYDGAPPGQTVHHEAADLARAREL